MIKPKQYPHKEMYIHSTRLIVPRETYQRNFDDRRARKIASEFDERIANEPKVSFRDGKYYVFDGQHTIAARKLLNDGEDLQVKCKVFFDMTEQEEALLFAQQTGISAQLSAGVRVRALIYGNDPDATAFKNATESVGLRLDYDQTNGHNRIPCISTAFSVFKKLGEEQYKETLRIVLGAWNGEPHSLRRENITGISRFINLYHDVYKPKRLIEQLRRVDPLTIYREGRAAGTSFTGYKKYLNQVYRIYNGSQRADALPMKF